MCNIKFLCLFFLFFVSYSHSVNFALSNIPKNLVAIIGAGGALLNYADASLAEDVKKNSNNIDYYGAEIDKLEEESWGVKDIAVAGLVLVVLGISIGTVCCCSLRNEVAKHINMHESRINSLSGKLSDKDTCIVQLEKRLGALEKQVPQSAE